MKYKGCILEFTSQRNAELMCAFRRVIAGMDHIDVSRASMEVVNMPCSRFWVSEERAMVVVTALLRGRDVLPAFRATKREMFGEIYRRVLDLMKMEDGICLSDAVFKVVNSTAPKFYMTPRSAMETIYKIKRGFYG